MEMGKQMNKMLLLVEENYKSLHKKLHKVIQVYYAEKYGASDEEVQIKKDSRGKPYVTIRGEKSSDFFNISHTSGVGVIIFSNHEVGIDIEMIGNADDRIAQRFFQVNEKQYLHDSTDDMEYQRRFYEIWTKKEAYLKWNGIGLADNLIGLDVLAKQYAFQYIEIDGKEYALAVYGQSRWFFETDSPM